jgi:carbonic anhydrase
VVINDNTSTSEKQTSPALFGSLSKDIPASLVVFLVAIPLGLGIALASGAPIMAGLIGCIVGGIVAGVLSGAPLQVLGPAAGLTVIVFGMVQKFGWPTMCAITAAAGLIQICLGCARIARVCLAISPAVVHGMLAGIGIVIALAQLHVLLGDKPQSSAVANIKALPGELLYIVQHLPTTRTHAAIVGLVTLAVLFLWQYLPKKVQAVPGALVAVLVGTLIANFVWTDAPRVSIPEGPLFSLQMPTIPADIGGFIVAALTIALVASVESLLCAVATDKLHTGPRANLDKELIAQGAANTVSGMIGGLPVTGVIVRSTANITAGAQTRLSAILHGVWILVFVLLASRYLERIPLAALAGLLVFVGIRLVNLHHIRELTTHREVVVYAATVAGVTLLDLLSGVGIGIGLAVLLLLRRLAKADITVEEKEQRWHVTVAGNLTFLSVPQLMAALGQIPPGAEVDVDLMAEFMDHAAFDARHGWRITHERLGGKVDIDELHEAWNVNTINGSSNRQETATAAMG